MNRFRQTALIEKLTQRDRIFQAARRFFHQNNFIEVETPNRIPAPAPEANIEAEPAGDWFLHTSPELCMKRLLAAGYRCIFQICKCYRKKERGRRHVSEFTLLEWYQAQGDYLEMMDQTEALICFVAEQLGLEHGFSYQGQHIDLKRPWPRLTVSDAFKRYSSLAVERALAEDRFDEAMVEELEPAFDQSRPLFLYDYPAACGALARLKPGDSSVAERFELYMGGLEICNAFTELTDAKEQRKRFKDEQQLRKNAGKPIYPDAAPFLDALNHMPPATGNALGLDRLVMLFTDSAQIDEILTFVPEEL